MFPFADDGNNVSGIFVSFEQHDTNRPEIDIPLVIFFQGCVTVLQREPDIGPCDAALPHSFQRVGAIREAAKDWHSQPAMIRENSAAASSCISGGT